MKWDFFDIVKHFENDPQKRKRHSRFFSSQLIWWNKIHKAGRHSLFTLWCVASFSLLCRLFNSHISHVNHRYFLFAQFSPSLLLLLLRPLTKLLCRGCLSHVNSVSHTFHSAYRSWKVSPLSNLMRVNVLSYMRAFFAPFYIHSSPQSVVCICRIMNISFILLCWLVWLCVGKYLEEKEIKERENITFWRKAHIDS